MVAIVNRGKAKYFFVLVLLVAILVAVNHFTSAPSPSELATLQRVEQTPATATDPKAIAQTEPLSSAITSDSNDVARVTNVISSTNLALEKALQSVAPAEFVPSQTSLPNEESTDISGLKKCQDNLKEIWRVALAWAKTNHNRLPEDFFQITNALNSPYTLICPSDPNPKPAFEEWSDLSSKLISYRIVPWSFYGDKNHPYRVIQISAHYVHCPIHKNNLDGDGYIYHSLWTFKNNSQN